MSWIKGKGPTANWLRRYFEGKENSSDQSSLIIAHPQKLDLHLSYSKGLEKGPIIQRSGDGPPIMEDPEVPGSYTTDPDRQRIGTYYILEENQESHSEELFLLFAGSYILYSALPGVDKPWKTIEAIFLDHSASMEVDSLSIFLEDPEFAEVTNIGRLHSNIVDSIKIFKNFLAQNPAWFKKPLPFFEDYPDNFADLERRAAKAMGKLYMNYPVYIPNFHAHRNERGFRSFTIRNVGKYLELFFMSRNARSHEELAKVKTRENELGDIVLMQGCGDLTMNLWNVAFVSGLSYHRTETDERDWDLLHPPAEPLNDREYSCLIKWKCDRDDGELRRIAENRRVVYPYQIAKLQFKAPSLESEIGLPNRHVFLGGEPIGHLIEFAVYGQHICRDQEVNLNKFRSVIREFGDIRHIYKLPNINPDVLPDVFEHETREVGIAEYSEPPRLLFNESTYADVWLCEKGLIQGDRNLRVAALNQAIQFDKKELGAPKEWIDIVLQWKKYQNTYVPGNSEELSPGQWRWIPEGRQTWLEIFLRRNEYPCTMIGVTAEDEKAGEPPRKGEVVDTESVFFLAHGHKYGSESCTIEEAARFLKDRGAWNALLFDEGWDVFQLVWSSSNGKPDKKVELQRNQLRCIFWANERKGS